MYRALVFKFTYESYGAYIQRQRSPTVCSTAAPYRWVQLLFFAMDWPLNQFDNGSESLGHALVLVLGLILLKNSDKLNSHFL